MKRILFMAFWGVLAFSENAMLEVEHPSFILLHDTVQNSALDVECKLQKNQTLDCSFVQMRVSNEAKPEELEEKLESRIDGYLTDSAPLHFEALKRILDREEPDYKA